MKPKYFLFFCLSFYILNSTFSIATVRYVSKTGTSQPPYTSWQTAADSIQKCINICSFGDTVYVANGIYKEQVIMIPGLSLIGAGLDSCIIDTQELVTSLNFHSVEVLDSCLFTGFTVIVYPDVYWGSYWGYGIAANGNCLITLNKVLRGRYGISNNSAAVIYKNYLINISQGVYLFNSNAKVSNNIIYTDPNSQAASDAGIHLEAFNNSYEPIIDSNYIEVHKYDGIYKSFGTRSIILNNTIKLKGVGATGILFGYDSVFIKNNAIYSIEGSRGIDHRGGNNSELFNNNIFGNFNNSLLEVGSSNVVKNNTITGGNLNGVKVWNTSGLVFRYNNVWNNAINYTGFTPDTSNISVDPMVVNDDTTQGELDFHLQKFSPLIDAGDPNILDRDGSRSDIGLYGGPFGESYKYQDLPPRIPFNFSAVVDSPEIKLSWNKNTELDFRFYRLYRDTVAGFQISSANLAAELQDTFYIQGFPQWNKNYYYKITSVDNQTNESEPSTELFINITTIDDNPMTINDYQLYQNYPNPFNPTTKIGYRIIERGYVKLYVYDIKGELVSVLVNKEQEAGYYEVEFTTNNPLHTDNNLASGVYIYQLFVKGNSNIPVFSDIKKMLMIK
ncbi:MAG: hypothetical protein IT276_16405 [Ignavibacteriaceae bacterium]|nr:hypothetical protein [Ignavibacterium sp.]MCC6256497.1 hypothetical protein [Ignavibacteriaceae bacterium]